jgi:hypothetical protein
MDRFPCRPFGLFLAAIHYEDLSNGRSASILDLIRTAPTPDAATIGGKDETAIRTDLGGTLTIGLWG